MKGAGLVGKEAGSLCLSLDQKDQRKKKRNGVTFQGRCTERQVALLAGGASGIGFEVSLQFGIHGASIAIMGRRKSVLDSAVSALHSLGIPAVGFEGDVRKQEDAKIVVESTVKHFRKLDILVNAAAGNFLVSPEDLSPNGFRTALKYLKKGGPGRSSSSGGMILNISATLHDTASWYQIHVSAAKAAVDSITRSLALEWGTDYDIRVNEISPGLIIDTTGLSKLSPEEINSKAREYMPLYKLGEKWPCLLSTLHQMLVGKYVNGTTIVVDGGLWLSQPRNLSKDAVKELSRAVEKRSRATPVGLPVSKM